MIHSDFANSKVLFHEDVEAMYKATGDRVQSKFTTMNTELTRIINNWEMSGQGEGGESQKSKHTKDTINADSAAPDMSPGGPVFGCLTGRPPVALHRRANFVSHSHTYLLYFWELFDKHQLLRSALQ
jgi:hypothetical protein